MFVLLIQEVSVKGTLSGCSPKPEQLRQRRKKVLFLGVRKCMHTGNLFYRTGPDSCQNLGATYSCHAPTSLVFYSVAGTWNHIWLILVTCQTDALWGQKLPVFHCLPPSKRLVFFLSVGADFSCALMAFKEKLLCGFRFEASCSKLSHSYFTARLSCDVRFEWRDIGRQCLHIWMESRVLKLRFDLKIQFGD